ncbi:choline-sulfatase [Pelagibius sp. Alg239-R121]|uniref:choline-sulfatase n=1 Tax=Pelagibius sp. Alg239-R121 TaxID=2993448 RepID=UPI0024A6D81D|nr:choline-sulfatase [Pelagibius sp. Alg239-R121]
MLRENQPNILLIMADQLAAQALSLYGNGVCKTPNLDRLATRGTVFEYAYSNNPLCVPSRASMLTGLLSPNIGVNDNANELASSVPTMAHYLRHCGYWTELCGKMHFIGPDQLHGFNDRSVTDIYPASFQWIADWAAGPSFVASGTALNGVVEAGPCVRTLQEDYDDEVEHAGLQSLYDLARRPERSPFFQIISFTSPHTPFTVSQEYWDRYTDEEIDMPAVGAIPFEELDYHSKALFFAHGRHRHRITEDHLRRARHAYYGMISYLDDKVGRIIETLEKTGQRDNTAIFFVSDHGEMLGERGMWFKHSFWDWSARVPFIASIPGMPEGCRSRQVVSLVDLLPTFLDLAGNGSDSGSDLALDGNSVLPLARGAAEDWPDLAISDYLAIGPCVPCRMLRRGRYKYILTHGHPPMLFDLETDPLELNDVVGDPQLAGVVAELHRIATNGWEPDALTEKVLQSQRRRKLISEMPGDAPDWNYLARKGDDGRYVRADGVDATKGRMRLPPVPAVPCDWPVLEADVVEELIDGKRALKDVLI